MRKPRRKAKNLRTDLQSVADQPARAVFFAGVIMALIMGLAIRGLISPDRIKVLLMGAAQRIHPDLQVTFSGAHVELSRGGFPSLAVVVENIQMQSSQVCWLQPRLTADYFRLPVSLRAFLLGESPFRVIQAGKAQLRMSSTRPGNCAEVSVSSLQEQQAKQEETRAIHLVKKPDTRPKQQAGEIEGLEIDEISIELEGTAPSHALLKDVFFQVRSHHPRVLQIQTRVEKLAFFGYEDWDFPVQIHADYNEFPENFVELRLDGRIREGAYQMKVGVDLARKNLLVAASAQHLPLLPLLEWAKKSQIFQPKQSWLSGQVEWSGPLGQELKGPIQLKDLQVEGDLAEMVIPQLSLRSISAGIDQPIKVSVQKIDLDRLLSALGHHDPSHMFGHMGHFQGNGLVTNFDVIDLEGDHMGLSFIFSNQGRRVSQGVGSMRARLKRNHQNWQLQLDEIELEEGQFPGEIEIRSSNDLQDVTVQARSSGLQFSKQVQKLMLGGGGAEPIAFDVLARFEKSKLASAQGQFRLAQALVNGVEIKDFSLKVQGQGGAIILVPEIKTLVIPRTSASGDVIQKVMLASSSNESTSWIFKDVRGQFRYQNFELFWNALRAKTFDGKSTFTSKGQWDAEGVLGGQIETVSTDGKRSWLIMGTRDTPLFQKR